MKISLARWATAACAAMALGAALELSIGQSLGAAQRSSSRESRSEFAWAAQGDFARPDTWAAGRAAIAVRRSAAPVRSAPPTPGYRTKTFWVSRGVGEPWGLTADRFGNVWFAEPGCDFEPRCGAGAHPGQIGKLSPSSRAVALYALPRIPGNQPIFVTLDNRGKLWFTTPDNSRIGEFDPATRRFIGQWPVKAGSGPWDLTVAAGRIWYTEHFGAAVGSFNPVTHKHRDFRTPSAHSRPYGIAADRGTIWFTENDSSVDRVAALDTRNHNTIREYPIVLPQSGTPHMITIGPGGHPWWTEGFAGTLATLNPATARPGSCGTASGTCRGVRRFSVPAPSGCPLGTHTSGIAFDRSRQLLWLDDSLSSQVGSFDPRTGSFRWTGLSDCNAHPHDGLILAHARTLWFDEEFANAIGELIP